MGRTLAFRPAATAASAVCIAVLAGCASTAAPEAPTVVRTRAPIGYQKAIGDYFSLTVPGSQKTRELSFGQPQPGGCPLGGYRSSERGWVVPVVSGTRTGVPGGRDSISITAKEHYFWFLGDTIAGITPRIELCP